MPDFVIRQWSAWAPEIDIRDDRLIATDDIDIPNVVPKLMQRRLSLLAKAVFAVAERCLEAGQSLPVVFSSSHGEICRSLEMLKIIQAGEELSPTAFSLSVHNAIAGLYSIAFNNREEITVLAPCQEGIAAAFAEGLGQLQEGKDEVLLILYDEPIASFYPTEPYQLTTPTPCVLGLRIAAQDPGEVIRLSRIATNRNDGEQPLQLLAFIAFLLADEKQLTLGNQGHSWSWQKL